MTPNGQLHHVEVMALLRKGSSKVVMTSAGQGNFSLVQTQGMSNYWLMSHINTILPNDISNILVLFPLTISTPGGQNQY